MQLRTESIPTQNICKEPINKLDFEKFYTCKSIIGLAELRYTILKKKILVTNKVLIPLSYMILGLTIVLILLTHSPIIGNDTSSYVNFSSGRPPLYPIFIWLFKWCGTHQFEAVVWAKTIIFGISFFYARAWLRQRLNIPDFLIFIVCCVTTVTTFRMVLVSEDLTIPLFIVAFFTSVDVMKEFQLKKIILLSILVSLLVLTRNQFYFYYLFFLWLIFWYCWIKIPKIKIVLGASILCFSIVSTSLVSKLYSYFIHAPTTCDLFLSHQLIIQPLYLADMNAIYYFKDPAQKEYIQTVLTQIKKQKLTASDIPLSPIYPQDIYSYYGFNYDPIAYINCYYLANIHIPLAYQDHFMTNIAIILFLHDLKKNLYFFAWKYTSFFGSIPFAFAVLIVLSAACFRLSNRYFSPSIEQVFIIVGLVLVLSNNAVVALVAGGILRYLSYNYFIYYCIAALAADRVFLK